MRYGKTLIILTFAAVISTASQAQRSTWKNPDLDIPERNSLQSLEPIEVKSTVIIKGRLGLEVRRICQYQLSYTDKGSGGDQDVTFYTPVLSSGYSMIGGYVQGNYWDPADCVITVKPDNNPQSNQLLRLPSDWQQVWTDKNSGARMSGSIWHPVSPDPSYVCLGSIAKQGYGKPNPVNYTCLHRCLIETIPSTNYVWSDKGTGASQSVSVYKLHNSNSYYALSGYNRPGSLEDIKGNPVCNF